MICYRMFIFFLSQWHSHWHVLDDLLPSIYAKYNNLQGPLTKHVLFVYDKLANLILLSKEIVFNLTNSTLSASFLRKIFQSIK